MLSRPRMCEGGVVTWIRSLAGQCQRVLPVPDRGAQGRVGVPDRFGQTGRARTEHQHGIRCWIGLDMEAFAGHDRLAGVVQMQHRHQPGQHRMVAHGVRRLRDRQRVLGFGLLPRRAEQHDRGTQAPDGLHGHDPLRPVRRHQRDPVTRPHPPPRQRPGQPAGQRLQPRRAVLLLLEDERDPVRRQHERPPSDSRESNSLINRAFIPDSDRLCRDPGWYGLRRAGTTGAPSRAARSSQRMIQV